MNAPENAAIKGSPAADFSEEPDEILLTYIGADEGEDGLAAWGELYRRHFVYLYKVCHRAYKKPLGDVGVEDLVANTFLKVRESAAKTYKELGSSNEAENRRNVLGWLACVAKNLVKDLYRGKKINEQNFDEDYWKEMASIKPQSTPEIDSLVQNLMKERLNETEIEILQTTFHWFDVGAKNQRLPSDVLSELANHLGMTTEGIRQKRKRAIEKIKVPMEEALAKLEKKG